MPCFSPASQATVSIAQTPWLLVRWTPLPRVISPSFSGGSLLSLTSSPFITLSPFFSRLFFLASRG